MAFPYPPFKIPYKRHKKEDVHVRRLSLCDPTTTGAMSYLEDDGAGNVRIYNSAGSGGSLVQAALVSLTETTGAGVYTGSITVPAGGLIHDIKAWSTVLWTATTSATMKVGDATDDDGWFTGVNLKATDLLVGEELNFTQTGGKEGVYLVTATGLRSTAYSATARVISFIVTTVGAAGSAGRSFGMVVWSIPTATAATKV